MYILFDGAAGQIECYTAVMKPNQAEQLDPVTHRQTSFSDFVCKNFCLPLSFIHTHTHTCTHTHTHTHTRTQPQRSDYLHRKLYEALSDIPNVYFPTWRMATIWGGASLLQMLLRSMEDLEYVLTDWKWDYLINLSESDFPLQ